MEEPKKISDKEMFEALEKAGKLYESYLRLIDPLSAVEFSILQEDYNRDMKFPLNIVIGG